MRPPPAALLPPSTTCMEFSRSLASPGLACQLQHREQLNQVVEGVWEGAQVTHWLDGSNIYGSTEDEARGLRAPGGRWAALLHPGAQAQGVGGGQPAQLQVPGIQLDLD